MGAILVDVKDHGFIPEKWPNDNVSFPEESLA
jgi:hypothetical protein